MYYMQGSGMGPNILNINQIAFFNKIFSNKLKLKTSSFINGYCLTSAYLNFNKTTNGHIETI